MKRFRHRSLRARFAMLAIVGLLWSHLVLAAHPLCSAAAMAMAETTMVEGHAAAPCHDTQPSPSQQNDEMLCVAHCSQGDLTNDVTRVPAVPAVLPVTPAVLYVVFLPAGQLPDPDVVPPVSWHRPTAHPAALLLI